MKQVPLIYLVLEDFLRIKKMTVAKVVPTAKPMSAAKITAWREMQGSLEGRTITEESVLDGLG